MSSPSVIAFPRFSLEMFVTKDGRLMPRARQGGFNRNGFSRSERAVEASERGAASLPILTSIGTLPIVHGSRTLVRMLEQAELTETS